MVDTAIICPLERAVLESGHPVAKTHTVGDFGNWIQGKLQIGLEPAINLEVGSAQSAHIFREKKVPLHHEFALVSFKHHTGAFSWLRLERAARYKDHFFQADSFGPVLKGAELREKVSFATTMQALIPSPVDEIASATVNASPSGEGVPFHHFARHIRYISNTNPQYQLFSANCRWFARRIVLSFAQRLHQVGPEALTAMWAGKPTTYARLHHEIQGDPFGGRQLEGKKGGSIQAENLRYLAFAQRSENQLADALNTCSEALRIVRAISADGKGRQYLLASVLSTLFDIQSRLGQKPEALVTIQLACATLEATQSISENSLLGLLYRQLVVAYASNRKPHEAVQAMRDCVGILRGLGTGSQGFDLAFATHSLAGRLYAVDALDEALETSQAALDLYQEMYRDDPDLIRGEYADIIHFHTVILRQMDRLTAAYDWMQQAVSLARDTITHYPPYGRSNRAELLRLRLANYLHDLAFDAASLGAHADACVAQFEAVEQFRSMFLNKSGTYGSARALCISLRQLSSFLEGAGRLDDALAASQETLDTGEEMPDREKFGVMLKAHADLLGRMNRWNEAYIAMQRCTSVYRSLVPDPSTIGNSSEDEGERDRLTAGFAQSLTGEAACASEIGLDDEAITSAKKSVDLFLGLFAKRPDDYQLDLTRALQASARTLSKAGRTEDALRVGANAASLSQVQPTDDADRNIQALSSSNIHAAVTL